MPLALSTTASAELSSPRATCIPPTAAPAVGSVTAPSTPDASPLQKPPMPPSYAPCSGDVMRPPTPRKSPFVSDLSPEDVPAVRLRGRRVENIRKLGSCSQRPTSLHDARGAASPDELGSALRGVPQTNSQALAKAELLAEAPAIFQRRGDVR